MPIREWIAARYMVDVPTCADPACPLHHPAPAGPLPDLRILARVGDRMELTGSLACTTLARRCLHDPDALALENSDAAAALGVVPRRTISADSPAPWERYCDDIRAAMLTLLARGEHSLATRLFCLATFAERTRPFYYRGVEVFDEAALAGELALIEDPAELEQLARNFAAMNLPGAVSLRAVAEVLNNRVRYSSVARFRELIQTVFGGFAAATKDGPEATEAAIIAAWAERRSGWEAGHGDILDQAFTRYASLYWLRDLYTDAPDLLVYTQNLCLRLAVLKFLLFFHPSLEFGADAPDAAERLTDALVEVMALFAAAVEEDPAFLRECEAALARAGVHTLGHTVLLLGC
ncbi:MAG: hypothetical protein ABI587_00380 [Gemmatimonadales bacterium]